MQKKCENGFTLVEILASITILSILTIGLLFIFPKAYFFTKENQTKTIAINLAHGVLHYFEKQDYDLLAGYRRELGDTETAILDTATICSAPTTIKEPDGSRFHNIRLFPDAQSCAKILAPTINNVTYDKRNIQVYLLPNNWGAAQITEIANHIQAVHPKTPLAPITNGLSKLQKERAANMMPVIVYIDLNENDDTEGILLEGSIADESIR
ncbi:MAG: prepilin-type N-terminal cleavage/methylation domain-containing protein [Ectobacillus sp.]